MTFTASLSAARSTTMTTTSRLFPLLLTAFLFFLPGAKSILPTASIDVRISTSSSSFSSSSSSVRYTMLASQASFGSYPPMSKPFSDDVVDRPPVLPPSDDELLCNEADGKADYRPPSSSSAETTDGGGGSATMETFGSAGDGGIMLVPRGKCTFERKALSAQRLGASGIIVYGTLASRYNLNVTKYDNDTAEADRTYTIDDVVYPHDKFDYDCDKGRAAGIPSSQLSFDPLPYDASTNDPQLTGSDDEGNVCAALVGPSFVDRCQSKRCLLTGKTDENAGVTEACCAWDLHVWMYADRSIAKENEVVSIPAFYVTMEQGDELLALHRESSAASNGAMTLGMYRRYKPKYNPSAAIIWMLGVAVAAISAYLSAGEYREVSRRILKHREWVRAESYESDLEEREEERGARDRSRSPNTSRSSGMMISEPVAAASPLEQEGSRPPAQYLHMDSNRSSQPDESLELNVYHAIGFIVMASSGLLILFFFQIYNVVKVMYAFGCSGALTQVLFFPLYRRLAHRVGALRFAMSTLCNVKFLEIGPVTRLEALSAASGYGLGLAWLIVAFTVTHPETNVFFWIVQDVMGACMCVLFLSIMKLNSIKVASVLLIVAFLYDIFFVFVTPYLFKGKSVMITVATSGGPPKADPSWCEKYPSDPDCRGGDPLPMLFTIPRIGDYEGGASLLGLGDIVLPGLLLSFASRYDEAKRLVGLTGGGNGTSRSNTCPETDPRWCRCLGLTSKLCNGGYLLPVTVAYAIGLLMANVAVYVMKMGQPALLYLVPCCLGTMVALGKRRNELEELWAGPKVLKTADALLYGEEGGGGGVSGSDGGRPGGGGRGGGGAEDDGEADGNPTAAMTARDGDSGGDVPLLSMT